MLTDAITIYFLISMGVMVVLIYMFFKFYFATSDMVSRITGIWSNNDDSIRILIYSADSATQAEVVWTKNNDDKILGSRILVNMQMKSFGWSTGTYIHPVTKKSMDVRLKFPSTSNMLMRFSDPQATGANQKWKLVR